MTKSLSIGGPSPENIHGRESDTAERKQSLSGELALPATGFVGDILAAHRHHGGGAAGVFRPSPPPPASVLVLVGGELFISSSRPLFIVR